MLELLNALAAVLAVTVALTLTSLDRPVAMLLGLTGSLTGSFLAWVSAPAVWDHSVVLPWAASVVGTVTVVAGWAAVRAYSGLFTAPDGSADDAARRH